MIPNWIFICLAFLTGAAASRFRMMAVRSFANQKAVTWVCSIIENGRALYGKGPTASHALWDLRQKIPKPITKKTIRSKKETGAKRVQFSK